MPKETETIVKVEKVSKVFKLPHEKLSTVKQHFVNVFNPKSYEKFKALDDVSFEIKKGEFFGIVGANGSGKSTLLKILAGIYQPTSGKVTINGSLSPFIELGVGFNPELTARENIFLNAAILGLTKKDTEERFDEIVNFSELENFLDQKLKNFSSGMQVRLAFSIAIQAHADILLVDEVLAVGDTNFQQKCFSTFRRLKKDGRTVILVTHDLDAVKGFCDKALLMSEGKVLKIDTPSHVVNDYISIMVDKEGKSMVDEKGLRRWGDQKVKITDIWLETIDGLKKNSYSTDNFRVKMRVKFYLDTLDPVFGIVIRRDDGVSIFESNTYWAEIKTGKFKKGSEKIISWEFENFFETAKYTISPAVAYNNRVNFFDWWEDAVSFIIKKEFKTGGFLNFRHNIKID